MQKSHYFYYQAADRLAGEECNILQVQSVRVCEICQNRNGCRLWITSFWRGSRDDERTLHLSRFWWINVSVVWVDGDGKGWACNTNTSAQISVTQKHFTQETSEKLKQDQKDSFKQAVFKPTYPIIYASGELLWRKLCLVQISDGKYCFKDRVWYTSDMMKYQRLTKIDYKYKPILDEYWFIYTVQYM